MISVCMATYNGEKYIREQIVSILNQIGPNDELIISDDLSSDRTIEVINSLNDARIKIFMHKDNHGFTSNFENALFQAKGEYIFLADQDDIWVPGKVERCLAMLRNVDFVVTDCKTVDEKLNTISESRFKQFNIKKGFWRLMKKTRYLGCCMAFRRNILNASLPFPKNSYYCEHDLWIAAVAECFFDVELIPQQLLLYRRHGKNASNAGMTKGYPLSVKLKRRIYRLKCLYNIRNKVKIIKQIEKS